MPEHGSNQNALGAGMNTQISHDSGYSALKMHALSRLEETSRNLKYTPLSEQKPSLWKECMVFHTQHPG